jgi:hypothetical protein
MTSSLIIYYSAMVFPYTLTSSLDNNLYEKCKDSFEVEDQQMFEKFETQNFETVLRALHTTMLTNRIFDIQRKILMLVTKELSSL